MITALPLGLMSGHLAPTNIFTDIDSKLGKIFGAIYSNPMEMNVIFALLAAGIFYTVKSRAVQIRLFPSAVKAVFSSREGAMGGISSFQAFAIGIASRVGTGNIAGVAIAIVLGGPGAIFWMWVIAFLGMATGFMEAVLAQLFKVRGPDNTFRGGPAYYIRDGLGSKGWGAIFAIFLIFAFGFAFEMVQANTIANVAESYLGVSPWIVAIVLMVVSAPIIFGGLRPVARIAEVVAPSMALAYLILAFLVVVLNITAVPGVLTLIVKSAFGFEQVVGGSAGAFFAAITNGTKRGLFSNEAGMGSAPNAAAVATVKHPVQQGLIQSLGVFVDTILVCTATAFIVLLSGLYQPGASVKNGATLTVESLENALGSWVAIPMIIIIFVFAYSSILGNYTYAEVNWNFLRGMDANQVPLKLLVVVSIGLGSVMSLNSAWNLADIATAFMALLNIFALFLLSKYALGALQDWEAQRKANPGEVPTFVVTNNQFFPQGLPGDVWEAK